MPRDVYTTSGGERLMRTLNEALSNNLDPVEVYSIPAYADSGPSGWHLVCWNVDGKGNIGVRQFWTHDWTNGFGGLPPARIYDSTGVEMFNVCKLNAETGDAIVLRREGNRFYHVRITVPTPIYIQYQAY